jgi:hypothetical protein
MYPELIRLTDQCSTMNNNERLRSIILVESMSVACFQMIPRIESKEIQDL